MGVSLKIWDRFFFFGMEARPRPRHVEPLVIRVRGGEAGEEVPWELLVLEGCRERQWKR